MDPVMDPVTDPVTDPGAESVVESGSSAAANPDRPATTLGGAQISVEHRSVLAAVLGLVAAAVTIAWFSRALQSGALLDWVVSAGMALVGVVQLAVLRDSRAPLLVADDQGVRVRHGVTWTGLRWPDVERIEVEGRRRLERPFGWLFGDAHIVVSPRLSDDLDEAVAEGFSVPLTAGTKVVTAELTGDLATDLELLASGRAPVVVVSVADAARPEPAEPPLSVEDSPDAGDPGIEDRATEGVESTAAPDQVVIEHVPDEPAPVEQPEERFDPVAPSRPAVSAIRAELVRESVRVVASAGAIPEQRVAEPPVPVGHFDDVELDAPRAARPAADPVIGPMIAAARHRARLSVDELSERTRIRPHVLECIEVDDFEPCGGDFYARGHLRTLARIFGLDAQELLDLFDDRYAHAEIEARQVFEAELATGIGGGVRTSSSGPRWSLLAAAVLALGLIWGGARIFTETPQELVSPAPQVVDSAGLTGEHRPEPETTLAPLAFTAVGASPQVVVRDRNGRILWAGQLPEGQRQQVIGEAPFDVTASNGAAVKVWLLGKARGTVGSSSAADNRQFD